MLTAPSFKIIEIDHQHPVADRGARGGSHSAAPAEPTAHAPSAPPPLLVNGTLIADVEVGLLARSESKALGREVIVDCVADLLSHGLIGMDI